MGKPRKSLLDDRLEAYFATLRASPVGEALKRRMAHWQVYAAVSGSAMALATGASAAVVTAGARVTPERAASIRTVAQNPGSSKAPPFLNDPAFALARISHAAQALPTISAGGVVPIYSADQTIEPGEWVSIYGQNLAAQTVLWNGDFPTSLGGTSVTINGKPAYLSYVSPTQINLQAPDDSARGTVSVAVTTAAGTAGATVKLNQVAPSFSLLNGKYVAAIILRPDGSGAYGGGTYDILGPAGNSFGYQTAPAQPGDHVEIFGVGFGPTNPTVPAGQPFSGAASVTSPVKLFIAGVQVQPTFVGLSGAGLYQINLTVPGGLGLGVATIHAEVGGMRTQLGVLFSMAGTSTGPTGYPGYPGYYGGGGFYGYYFGGGMGGFLGGTPAMTAGGTTSPPAGTGGAPTGGTGGGSGGGTGGGSGGGTGALRRMPYQPRLVFPSRGESDDSVREG